MTFDEWYKANIEPTILIPPGVTPQQAQILCSTARRTMAACWNAAVDAACDEFGEHEGTDYDIPELLKAE